MDALLDTLFDPVIGMGIAFGFIFLMIVAIIVQSFFPAKGDGVRTDTAPRGKTERRKRRGR